VAANPATCAHPLKRCETPSFGQLRCKRCDTDLTDPARSFEHRAGERTTFRQGDRVHVKAGEHGTSFKGVWHWVETFSSGLAYCVAERQLYQLDKSWHEGTAAVRFVRPEYVRHDDGVRSRRRREESAK
jgi:hypothetical protein